jgi:hypothetical protein
MRLPLLAVALCALQACAPPAQVTKNRPLGQTGVGFGAPGVLAVAARPGGTGSRAQDFLDLTFGLESGRALDRFTRFEGPIRVALTGPVPATARGDLAALVARLRAEAGIDIALASGPANLTIAFVDRSDLRRMAPTAACFVVPNVGSLAEYRRLKGSAAVDWALIDRRERATVFIPSDTSPQEVRDCLHEEVAQAIGPLNDLYRLSDSVFNDDNFHSVLTAFDMDMLRLTYAPQIRSGMTRAEVAARLFGGAGSQASAPALDWTEAIETALGRKGTLALRQAAADRALAIALGRGWQDNRLAFSHFAVGRLAAGSDPARALEAFAEAAALYARLPGGAVQGAHVDMQLAAMALAGGLPDQAARLADRALPTVRASQNAALQATLMLIKAEALEQLGDSAAAAALRLDSAAPARYGFGPDSVVRDRMRDIAAVADRAEAG